MAVALTGLPLLGLVVHDLVSAQNGAQLFIWLFSYDYVNAPQGRPWPPELDYRTPLIVFAVLFAAAGGAADLAPPARRRAVVALALVAVAFTYFLLDVFIPQAAGALVAEAADRQLLQAARGSRRSR